LGPSVLKGPIIAPWSPIARWGRRYAYLSLDAGAADPHLHLGHVLKLPGQDRGGRGLLPARLRAGPVNALSAAGIEGLGWSEAQVAEFRRLAGAVDAERGRCTYGRTKPSC
jgi:hypothetical protein